MAGPQIRESVTVAGRAERAGVARAFAVGVLGPGHPCGDDAALLVSELFGNSVRHSKSTTNIWNSSPQRELTTNPLSGSSGRSVFSYGGDHGRRAAPRCAGRASERAERESVLLSRTISSYSMRTSRGFASEPCIR